MRAGESARRGDIFWLDFAAKAGAPVRKMRPALVVQNDAGNRYAPQVIVAAIRHDADKGLPVQVPIPRGVAGLTKDSVVDCGFLATVLKEQLGPRLGSLPSQYLRAVDDALGVSLGLK